MGKGEEWRGQDSQQTLVNINTSFKALSGLEAARVPRRHPRPAAVEPGRASLWRSLPHSAPLPNTADPGMATPTPGLTAARSRPP